MLVVLQPSSLAAFFVTLCSTHSRTALTEAVVCGIAAHSCFFIDSNVLYKVYRQYNKVNIGPGGLYFRAMFSGGGCGPGDGGGGRHDASGRGTPGPLTTRLTYVQFVRERFQEKSGGEIHDKL